MTEVGEAALEGEVPDGAGPADPLPLTAPPKAGGRSRCRMCFAELLTKSMVSHMREVHGRGKRISCPVKTCDFSTLRRRSLIIALRLNPSWATKS